MKAIHNNYNILDIFDEMLLIVQRYKNESNSQLPEYDKLGYENAFDSSKIQKWKQFTTMLMNCSIIM